MSNKKAFIKVASKQTIASASNPGSRIGYMYEIPPHLDESETAIYCLAEPLTGEVRYVGISDHPARRLGEHINFGRYTLRSGYFKKRQKILHIGHWIASLITDGLMPKMYVLEHVLRVQALVAERRLIDELKSIGGNLLNDGSSQRRYSIYDMHLLAEIAGGEFLSEKYLGILKNHEWRCFSCGRDFRKSPYRVISGSWCNYCLKAEREMKNIAAKDLMRLRSKRIARNF